jgi:hypothetical protein
MTKKLLTITILSLAAQVAFGTEPGSCKGLAEAKQSLTDGTPFTQYWVNEEFVKTADQAVKIWTPLCELHKKPEVKIGMNTKQMIDGTKWGKPDHINRTITATKVHEQWVYGDNSYLYFENGKLTAIQN